MIHVREHAAGIVAAYVDGYPCAVKVAPTRRSNCNGVDLLGQLSNPEGHDLARHNSSADHTARNAAVSGIAIGLISDVDAIRVGVKASARGDQDGYDAYLHAWQIVIVRAAPHHRVHD